MLSLNEKLDKLKSLIESGDIDQFDQLMTSDKFISNLPKRNPELLFLMYQGASNEKSSQYSVERANKLLSAAVSLKHPAALAEKGRIIFENATSSEDYMDAEDLFRMSIDQSPMSRYYIARIYHEGFIKKGDQRKFDHEEARRQLQKIVEQKGEFYVPSVILMARIILSANDVVDGDEVFFSAHVRPLANNGDEHALKLYALYSIIKLKKSIGMINNHNEKNLGLDYFDVKTSIKKAYSHLEEVSKLIGGS